MAFEDFWDSNDSGLMSIIGISATYTPSSGDPVTLTVNIQRNVEAQAETFTGQSWVKVDTLECLLAEAGKEPDKDETFATASYTYTVDSVIENDGTFVKMVVKSS